MPIVGMTRRQDVEDAAHRLVIGELRKGGPKTDAKKPGPDLDHWRFTSERKDVLAAFAHVYPNNPTTIDAYLPFPTMERNWITWFEEYDAGGLKHRCDGRTQTRWRGPDGRYIDGERPCPYQSGERPRTKDDPGCKQVGRLYLVLPALIRSGIVGLVTMETHSINDLVSITASLVDIENKTGGRLNGILLSVMRVKETISTPAWKEEDKAAGRRNRTTKDLVKIVPQAEWVMARLQVEANEQMALAAGKPLQLGAGNDHGAWEEGEWSFDEPDPEPEPEPETEQLGPAAVVLARLRTAGGSDNRPQDEATGKKLYGNLANLCGRDNGKIATLLELVFGVAKPSELTLGQANTLLAWINSRPEKDEQGKVIEWVPSGPALMAGEYKLLVPPEPELF